MFRLSVDPLAPDPAAIETAAAAIRAGRVVVIPTDTLYGLAANPLNSEAVQRLFVVKGRDARQAIPLIASDVEQVIAVFGPLPAAAARLADRFWPGPLTLLLPAPAAIAAGISSGTGSIGVRVPDHAVARALCRSCGHPLTATSANISGQPATNDPDAVSDAFGAAGEQIAVLLDAGKTPGGPPSTVVQATDGVAGSLTLVRAGAIPWEDIQACVRQ